MQLVIKLTTACNLNCVYCSEGDKPLATLEPKLIYKLIDNCPELLETTQDKDINFLWHGGEPLLYNKQTLDEIMNYATTKLKDYKVTFNMQSNGTLVDDEWLEILAKHNVRVGVSLDGYAEIHNENRLTKDGKATFDLIMKNIALLRSKNLYSGSLMVLDSSKNIDPEKIFQIIDKYKLSLKINALIPAGRAKDSVNYDVNKDNYINIMKDLYYRCLHSEHNVEIEPISSLLSNLLTNTQPRECSYNGRCCVSLISIYANGDVGFCGRSETNNLNLNFGSLHNSTLLELYESHNAKLIRQRANILKTTQCKDCNIWNYCMGGCSFEAVNYYGELNHKFPRCEQRRQLVNFLLTEGLDALQAKLIEQKQRYRYMIKTRKSLIKEIDNVRN